MWLIIIILLLYFSGYGVIVSPEMDTYGIGKLESRGESYIELPNGATLHQEWATYSWIKIKELEQWE